jgi:hypothetical protein
MEYKAASKGRIRKLKKINRFCKCEKSLSVGDSYTAVIQNNSRDVS